MLPPLLTTSPVLVRTWSHLDIDVGLNSSVRLRSGLILGTRADVSERDSDQDGEAHHEYGARSGGQLQSLGESFAGRIE
jgi:hypothetical protein